MDSVAHLSSCTLLATKRQAIGTVVYRPGLPLINIDGTVSYNAGHDTPEGCGGDRNILAGRCDDG